MALIKREESCYVCSKRSICHLLETVYKNNEMTRPPGVTRFLISPEDVGQVCQCNDYRLRE